MKKSSTIILTILIIINSINFVSYADCNMNINYEKLIDFSEIIEGKTKSITQIIGDKEITITRYDQISKIKNDLEKDNLDAIKKLVNSKSSGIDPNILVHVYDRSMDLLFQTSAAETNALNQIAKMIDKETLNKLTEEEQKKAATEGRDSAVIPTISSTTLSLSIGKLCQKGLAKVIGSKLAESILAKAGLTAGGAGATIVSYASGIATAALVLYGLTGAYNQIFVLPITKKFENLLSVRKHVYDSVKENILNHRWIDGNVLITAIPTNSSCTKGYAGFHNVDGIRYNKSQKAINWEFAKAECKFLNADHDDCYQEAKKTIDCLWDNLEDPSKCKNNPYYHPYSEDD